MNTLMKMAMLVCFIFIVWVGYLFMQAPPVAQKKKVEDKPRSAENTTPPAQEATTVLDKQEPPAPAVTTPSTPLEDPIKVKQAEDKKKTDEAAALAAQQATQQKSAVIQKALADLAKGGRPEEYAIYDDVKATAKDLRSRLSAAESSLGSLNSNIASANAEAAAIQAKIMPPRSNKEADGWHYNGEAKSVCRPLPAPDKVPPGKTIYYSFKEDTRKEDMLKPIQAKMAGLVAQKATAQNEVTQAQNAYNTMCMNYKDRLTKELQKNER